jgi:hypothetical protein
MNRVKPIRFRAVIQDAGGGGAYVLIPFEVEEVFGRKRVPVAARFDGVPYRGTLVRMGCPQHMLPVLKEIRARLGRSVGDEIQVELEEDREPRVVEVPADLRAALAAQPGAPAAWKRLSCTCQKEHVGAINEARRADTRARRVAQAVEQLAREAPRRPGKRA